MGLSGFLLSSGVTYAGTVASVLLMAAFYGASLRIGTESFGVLQSTTALLFVLQTCRGVVGGFVVIRAVGNGEPLSVVTRQGVKIAMLLGGVVSILLGLGAPALRDFLHMDTPLPFILIGLAAIPGFLSGMTEGVLNAQRRFGALAVSSAMVPAANLLFAFVLFRDGFQHADGGWLVLGSYVLSLLNLAFVDRIAFKRTLPSDGFPRLKEIGTLLVASLLFGAAHRVDVLWARHVLTQSDAGSYAIAAAISVVVFLMSTSIARVASVSLRSGSGPRVVSVSYAMIVSVSLLLAAAFFIVGERALGLVAGRTIDVDWAILTPLFIAAACFSIISLDYWCLNVLTKRVHVRIAGALVGIQVCALLLFGRSAISIAWVQCAVTAALTVVFSVPLARTLWRNRPLPRPHLAEAHLAHHG